MILKGCWRNIVFYCESCLSQISENIWHHVAYGHSVTVQRHRHSRNLKCDWPTDRLTRIGARDASASKNLSQLSHVCNILVVHCQGFFSFKLWDLGAICRVIEEGDGGTKFVGSLRPSCRCLKKRCCCNSLRQKGLQDAHLVQRGWLEVDRQTLSDETGTRVFFATFLLLEL